MRTRKFASLLAGSLLLSVEAFAAEANHVQPSAFGAGAAKQNVGAAIAGF